MVREPRSPKYLQVKEALLRQIREDGLQPGDQVISIVEIMERFGVSKVTAVRSLTELESEGVIRREQGRGTFVTATQPQPPGRPSRTTVAVVVPSMANPYYTEVGRSLEGCLRRAGIAVEFSSTDYDPNRERDVVGQIAAERRVAAIVIVSWQGTHELREALADTPAVFIDSCPPQLVGHYSVVGCDNHRGGFEAAQYLASMGHRRIGCITVPVATPERIRGFRDALQARRLPFGEDHVFMLEHSEGAEDQIVQFVRDRRLTALFAVNDMTAIQVLHALRLAGIRVPADVSIVGYDNIEAAQYLDVPLTTVEQHEEEIGRKAAELLLELLPGRAEAPRPAREVVFIPRLIVRASTSVPPLPTRAAAAAP